MQTKVGVFIETPRIYHSCDKRFLK